MVTLKTRIKLVESVLAVSLGFKNGELKHGFSLKYIRLSVFN